MAARFPFPAYPNGWFQVAYADELARGQVLPLKYFGKDLVLFRGEDGVARALDAHCPHLGAHLGHGGKTEGNCVVCPFHLWRFDGHGEVASIPYAKRIPPKARLEAWPLHEVNGLLMLYHHARGDQPAWRVPVLPEYGSDDWTPYERRRWKIRTRNQEMAENSVDTAHFRYVHGTLNLPTAKAEANGHHLHVTANNRMRTPLGEVEGAVDVNVYGFGFTATRFKGIVDTLAVTSVTAIDEDYVDVRFSFSVKRLGSKDATHGVGAAFIREIERQLEQDIPIWENKSFLDHPVLCDGDGPIGIFRNWTRQFYSEAAA
jgi:nitrite reductase/ring-hydroxylating ferredoxin subunit